MVNMAIQPTQQAPLTPEEKLRHERALKRLDRLAGTLDSKFRIPFTRVRFGLDPLIGLIPGIGDAAGLMMSLYVIGETVKLGAGPRQVTKMAGNVLVEFVVGLVPIAGDAFDLMWQANNRNAALLRKHIEARLQPQKPQKTWLSYALIGIFGALLLTLLVVLWQAIFSAAS
jgi:hypothetical protein